MNRPNYQRRDCDSLTRYQGALSSLAESYSETPRTSALKQNNTMLITFIVFFKSCLVKWFLFGSHSLQGLPLK